MILRNLWNAFLDGLHIPPDTTHVLVHVPSVLTSDCPDGFWQLSPVRDWLRTRTWAAGRCPGVSGPADKDETELIIFAEEATGHPAELTGFTWYPGIPGAPDVALSAEPGYFISIRPRLPLLSRGAA